MYWGASINPVAMMKRNPNFAAICRQSPDNFILCEKYTSNYGFHDIESTCLGTYLSGFSGQYGIRFDQSGWFPYADEDFSVAAGAAPVIEHVMLTGKTVIDGPELIWLQCIRGIGKGLTPDGYTTRRWEFFPQFNNISIDIFHKILDGTIRILSREEVIDRTKVAIINDIYSGDDRDKYSSPETLFSGLYLMDDDGTYLNQHSWFKKTGRYAAIPTVYQLADPLANSFQVQVNKSAYSSRWPNISDKVNEFKGLFPQEYTGDIYAGRYKDGWVTYNPFKSGQTASGSIPFKYNTCDYLELIYSQYTVGVIKEYVDKLTFYLTNYDNADTSLKIDVIKIYGSSSEPTWSYVDRANHQASTVIISWSVGVFTLSVTHNGPLDITVNCVGSATGRLTSYTTAIVEAPAEPAVYTVSHQYEAENFDYKYIARNVTNGVNQGISNYTGQGYMEFGTSSAASVRDYVTVLKDPTYWLETKYSVTGATINTIDLYVNGIKVATPTFTQTPTLSDWAVNTQDITLNAGTNPIEFGAIATGASSIYFDNIVIVPIVYGDGVILQENGAGFVGVDGTIDNTYSGYTGDGYANTDDLRGTGIDWGMDFDSSVTKSFTFRYACPDDRTADLIVNGEIIASEIYFPSTGLWSAWEFVTVYASADAGVSAVQLQSTSSTGLPNIDYMEVTGIKYIQTHTADLDHDGRIDNKDYCILANDFYEEESSADITPQPLGDGKADFKDLAFLVEYWLTATTTPPLPEQASSPNPTDNALSVATTANLSWTAGSGATSHDVYIGTSNPPPFISNVSVATFVPGWLPYQTTVYWRVDEINSWGRTTGQVWELTTVMSPPPLPGQASNPNPADGATGVSIVQDLSWTPGSGIISHDVYFGTSMILPFIKNQTVATFDPSRMELGTKYYWRINENTASGSFVGPLWSFTTTTILPPPSPPP